MTDSIRLTLEQFTAVILSMPSDSGSIISFRDGDMADDSDADAWLHYPWCGVTRMRVLDNDAVIFSDYGGNRLKACAVEYKDGTMNF